MITVIRVAALLLAAQIARVTYLGQRYHGTSHEVAAIAYIVAACIVTLVWGLGRLDRHYRRGTPR